MNKELWKCLEKEKGTNLIMLNKETPVAVVREIVNLLQKSCWKGAQIQNMKMTVDIWKRMQK